MDFLMDKDLYLFDFDGTIINTAPSVQAAINYMRRKYGLPEFTLKEAETLIGRGQDYTINMAIADGNGIVYEKAEALYQRYYEQNPAKNSCIYPGITKLLQRLKGEHKTMGIISNKYSYLIKSILDSFGYGSYFSLICGPDIVGAKKPEPNMVFYSMERIGVPLDRIILIGDSVYDVQTGKNAGITTAFVTHGYGSYDDVVREQPDYLLTGNRVLSFLKYNKNMGG